MFNKLRKKTALSPYIESEGIRKSLIPVIRAGFVKNWDFGLAFVFFWVLLLYISSLPTGNAEKLKEINTQIITVSSIISAIIITFLTAKVIQLRQEKLNNWNGFHMLTQQVHNFRSAVYFIYTERDFWVNGLADKMKSQYKDLTYYEVRKQMFVKGTEMTELATAFIRDKEYGDSKNLYLQLRSFFPIDSIMDPTIYTEFETDRYYSGDLLELWTEFRVGDGLYYYFNHEYAVFKNDFHFNAVPKTYADDALTHAAKVDKKRYAGMNFGPELYDKLGGQFSGEILPKLNRLTKQMYSGLPSAVVFITVTLSVILMFGIFIPIMNTLTVSLILLTNLSISMVLSVILCYCVSFHRFLSREIRVLG